MRLGSDYAPLRVRAESEAVRIRFDPVAASCRKLDIDLICEIGARAAAPQLAAGVRTQVQHIIYIYIDVVIYSYLNHVKPLERMIKRASLGALTATIGST